MLPQVWQWLVWKGPHGQAPVSVIAKPGAFANLDVLPSVRALLRHCPGFLASPQLLEDCRELPSVDYSWFCEVQPSDRHPGSACQLMFQGAVCTPCRCPLRRRRFRCRVAEPLHGACHGRLRSFPASTTGAS